MLVPVHIPVGSMVDCDMIKGAFCHGVVSKGNIQLEAVVALAGQLPVQPLDQLFGLFCREVVAGNEEFIAAHPQGRITRPTRLSSRSPYSWP